MMRFPSLTTVIAYIRTMMGVATQTQPVGHVHQEHIAQAGKVNSASDISQQSLAPRRSPRKQKAVKSTTQESKSTSKKRKPAQTGKSRSSVGNSTQTRASKTRQHVK
jgi:hypothetical protein